MIKALIAPMVLILGSCADIRLGIPPIRELYHEDAQRLARNPVIVIHGILGSRLVDRATGQVVWGAFTKDAIDVTTPEGARAFALDMDSRKPDRVVATGPVEKIDVDLLFGIISVDVYKQILRALGVGGYTDSLTTPGYAEDHYTCHSFFYDWRLDNVQNAMALGAFISKTRAGIDLNARTKVKSLRKEGTPAALASAVELEAWLAAGYRFDIVAHSMGGLIARYFLRFGTEDLPLDGSLPKVSWAGAEEVDRLVMVGTPNLGSIEALEELLNGMDLGLFLPSFDRSLLGSMPSIYQLLPRRSSRAFIDEDGQPVDLDLFDVDLWESNQWGLLDPRCAESLEVLMPRVEEAEERRVLAREYLSWCLARAAQFQGALDKDPESECPVELRLFASDTIRTKGIAILKGAPDGPKEACFVGPGTHLPGDGTVTRHSALGDRQFGTEARRDWLDTPIQWSSVTFLSDDHVGLTSNPQFTDNLLFYLLEQKPKRPAPNGKQAEPVSSHSTSLRPMQRARLGPIKPSSPFRLGSFL